MRFFDSDAERKASMRRDLNRKNKYYFYVGKTGNESTK